MIESRIYEVSDAKTGKKIITGTARECAERINVSLDTIYQSAYRYKLSRGKVLGRYYVQEVGKLRDDPVTSMQKCWECKKACGGCSWSRNLEPVPGWVATPSTIGGNDGRIPTYSITDCPEFEPDGRSDVIEKFVLPEEKSVEKSERIERRKL